MKIYTLNWGKSSAASSLGLLALQDNTGHFHLGPF